MDEETFRATIIFQKESINYLSTSHKISEKDKRLDWVHLLNMVV